MLTDIDIGHLRRCIEPARKALATGNPPFGMLLMSADRKVLAEHYNQIQSGDRTHHPEISMARWAAAHLAPVELARTTVHTSGQHGAMCSAAHGRSGPGRIAYATSPAQLATWIAGWNIPRSRVRDLYVEPVLIGVKVDGHTPELVDERLEIHRQFLHSPATE